MYVYKITNKINKKSYIGITDNYVRRFKNHINRSQNKKSKEYNKVLYKAFRKYGIENFSFEIIEENCNKNNIYKQEIYYINKHDTYRQGYNETIGGESPPIKSNLNEDDIINIRTRFNNMELMKDIYKDYGKMLTYQCFTNICFGKSWIKIGMINEDIIKQQKDINRKMGIDSIKTLNKINNHKPSKKLTKEEVEYIKKLYAKGNSINCIFNLYSYKLKSIGTIYNIIDNLSWKDVRCNELL